MGNMITDFTSRKLSVFSFFMSILIVWIHCAFNQWGITVSDYGYSYGIENFIQNLSGSAVPTFFIISAFLLFRKLSFGNFKTVFFARIKRLLIPYIIWSAICWLTIDYLRPLNFNVMEFLLLSNFNGPLWFILALVLYLLLTPPILLVFNSRKLVFSRFVVVSSFLIHFLIIQNVAFKQYTVYNIVANFPFFLFGAYLGHYHFTHINQEVYRSKKTIILSAAALFVFYSGFYNVFPSSVTNLLHHYLLRFQLLLWWIIIPDNWFVSDVPWWQNRTFFTYAAQWPFIYYATKIVDHLMLRNICVSSEISLYGRLLLTILISAVTILLGQICFKLSPRCYSVLIGEKNNMK